MARYYFKEYKSGFVFLELVLVLAIILFLCYRLLNMYFKKPSLDKETKKVLTEQGIDTTSYKATLDSTREKVEDITKQRMNTLDDIK